MGRYAETAALRHSPNARSRTLPAARLPRAVIVGFACSVLAAITMNSLEAIAQEALALTGDPAPVAAGGTYSSFEGLSINASGAVAFQAFLAGGTASVGLFLETGTTSEAIVLQGDPMPAPLSDQFDIVYAPHLTDAGEVFFSGTFASAPGLTGLFRWSSGVIEAIALPGDPVPVSGGTFSSITGSPAANAAGQVAFFGGIDGGSRLSGLFLYSNGSISPIVFLGDSSPGALPGNVSFLFTTGLSLNLQGDVSFPATLYDSTFPATSYDVVMVYSGGVLNAAAIQGDVPNGTGGSAYSAIVKETTSITDGGDVAFAGSVGGGFGSPGIFVDRVGQTGETIVFVGDPAPETGGGTFGTSRFPSINESGQVVFEADVLGSTINGGIWSAEGGAIVPIALEGDVAPGTNGGVFANFDGQPVLNDAGRIAFEGLMVGGNASRGVFVVPEPGIGSSLALGLLVIAAGRRRRRATR